jgi:hypothetical protein
MTVRADFLTKRLQEFLDRKAVPHSLQNKPQAQADEARMLLGTLLKYAPHEDEGGFWDKVKQYLDEESTSRAWPTGGELKKACLAAKPKPAGRRDEAQIDTFAINAGRFERGDAVGDEWLFGRLAREIVARGLVTNARQDEYRRELFYRMKETWNDDVAEARIAELWRRHRDADGRPALDAPPEPKFKRMAAE